MVQPLSLPRILGDLAAGRASGCLTIMAGETARMLYLKDGVLIQAASRLADETLGRIMVDCGWLSDDALGEALDRAASERRQLGDVLIASQEISPAAVFEALQTQVRVRVRNALRLREFEHQFVEDVSPPSQFVVRFPVPALVVEEVAEAYGVDRILEELGIDEEARVGLEGDAGQAAGDLRLGPKESRLLRAMERGVTVGELLAANELPYAPLLRLLYALWALRRARIEVASDEALDAAALDAAAGESDDGAGAASGGAEPTSGEPEPTSGEPVSGSGPARVEAAAAESRAASASPAAAPEAQAPARAGSQPPARAGSQPPARAGSEALAQPGSKAPANPGARSPAQPDRRSPPARPAAKRPTLRRPLDEPPRSAAMPRRPPKGEGGLADEVLRTWLRMPRQDYFQLLGIPRNAGPSDVKIGYGGLLRRLRLEDPPAGWSDQAKKAAGELLDQATAAFALLSNTDTRRAYEAGLRSGGQRILDPDDPLVVIGVARQKAARLRGRGQHREAAEVLRVALRKAEKEPCLHLDLGVTLFEMSVKGARTGDEAAQALAAAARLDPAKDTPWVWLGRLARSRHQPDHARKMFRKALSVDPRSEAGADLRALDDGEDKPGLLGRLFGK